MTSESRAQANAYQRAWTAKRSSDPAWRAKKNAQGKKWRDAHPEKVKAIRAANAAYARSYRAKHHAELRAYFKVRYHANREHFVDQEMRRKYGIGIADYAAMLAAQGGGCKICGAENPNPRKRQRFHIDHNHQTGKVRGLLCSECNIGLGKFKDDSMLLDKASHYLRAEFTAEVEAEALLQGKRGLM